MKRGTEPFFFSLAELAYVIVFVLLLLLCFQLMSSANIKRQLADVNSQLNEYRSKYEKLSNIPPDCQGWLALIEILGRNSFLVDGEVLDIKGIAKKFKADIIDAKKTGCVQKVKARPGEGVTLDDFISGARRLERFFYVRQRPRSS